MRPCLSVAIASLAVAALAFSVSAVSADQSTPSQDELRQQVQQCLHGMEAAAQVSACSSVLSAPGITAQQSATVYLMRGKAYRQLMETDKALADLDEAITRRADLIPAYANRAQIRMTKRDYRGAADDFGVMIDHMPPTPDLLNEYGIALDYSMQHDKAIEAFSKAIDLAPSPASKAQYLTDRGAANVFERKLDLAAADYAAALQANPQLSEAAFAYGRIKYLKGDYPAATTSFLSGLATAEGEHKVYGAIWLYLAALHQGDAALAAAKSATQDIDISAWPGPALQVVRGDRSPEAIELPNDHLFGKAGPSCELNFYLGEQALAKGDKKAAIDFFNKSAATGISEYFEYTLAQIELETLKQ